MIEVRRLDKDWFPHTSLFFNADLAKKYIKLYNNDNSWEKWIMIDKDSGEVLDSYNWR